MRRGVRLIERWITWDTESRVGRHDDGRPIIGLGGGAAFVAPSEEAAHRLRRRIFIARRLTYLVIAALLAQVWLRLGPLDAVLLGPPLALALAVVNVALPRLWVRGWERCEWAGERRRGEPLETARRGQLLIAGVWTGALLVFLAITVWFTAGFRHPLGAILGVLGLGLALVFGWKARRGFRHAPDEGR
jgi:hypothetical protein